MSYNLQGHTLPSKLLYIDSRDATNYLATDLLGNDLTSYFTYVLKENIEIPSNQRCLIALHSATIPYSFYNIRDGVNDLVKMTLGGSSKTVDIPVGNYTALSLATFLETEFASLWGATLNSISITFDPDTAKFSILINTDAELSSSLEFSPTLASAHVELGFRPESIPMTTASDGGGKFNHSVTSQNVVDINGSIHGIYIRSNLVSKGTLDSQNGVLSNILARMPLNVQRGGILFWEPANATHKSVVDLRTINAITIRLTDERNRILDLNGLHFQICISVDFIYAQRPNDIPRGVRGKNGDSYINDYSVRSDLTGTQKVQLALEQRELEYQQQLAEERAKRRGPGRPRRVGRPKGT